MVTASHNPAPFNGYKVYGEDGGQMPPADDALTDYIRAIENPFTVQLLTLKKAKLTAWLKLSVKNVDAEYLKEVKGVNINQDLINEYGRTWRLSTLHFMVLVKCWLVVLCPRGFEAVQVVEAQAVPDADFSTVKSPNPENQAALLLLKNLVAK